MWTLLLHKSPSLFTWVLLPLEAAEALTALHLENWKSDYAFQTIHSEIRAEKERLKMVLFLRPAPNWTELKRLKVHLSGSSREAEMLG